MHPRTLWRNTMLEVLIGSEAILRILVEHVLFQDTQMDTDISLPLEKHNVRGIEWARGNPLLGQASALLQTNGRLNVLSTTKVQISL
ncbi:hypothetical protein V6N12_050256 [Hibiscus sabdariffa]|uniref:Uncharacterized protein n=1 Tax=Hibiscus sabdariffa TaxID=183260 RepID=A0ABR2GBX4_9ROSI